MRRTWTSKDKFTYIKAIHKNNYSQAKSLHLTSGVFTPCPIKPTQNAIPKDLNLQSIFTNMLQSSQTLNKSYPIPYKTHIYQNTNLSSNRNTNINSFTRKSLLKSIYDFFSFFHIDHKIFFKTILLYDMISIENEKKKLLSSMEEIALGAMIISIKFNYIENKMFSMKKFLQFYGEQVFSLSEIIDIERKALQTINYFLNFTTPMCFLEFFLINGIIYNTDGLNKENYSKIYIETENILKNMMEESNNYLKFNFFYLACSVVAYCREIFNLEKWPKTLEKVFSVNYYYFQNEYTFFFGKIINASIGRIYDNKTFNSNGNKDIFIDGNNNILLLDIENLENNNSINSLNSINSITSINSYNNYFGKYNHLNSHKTNNYKTIDYYNNIINININNVSVNNIFNNGIKNNFIKEKNINNNSLSNRSNYKRHFTSIYYNNIKKYNNRYNISLQNIKNSESEEKENEKEKEKKEITDYSNKNLSNKLPEIKEVKEAKDNSEINMYKSPPKRKRKHYFIFNKEENKYVRNINNTIETEEKEIKNENEENKEIKENNRINAIVENRKKENNENNENVQDKENIPKWKERTEKRSKRNHFIYYSNNCNNKQKDIITSNILANNIKGFDIDENTKKELNIKNNISSNNSKGKIGTIEINSIRINRNNFKDNEIKIENNRCNRKRTSNNLYNKLNSEKDNKMDIESNKNSLQASSNNITDKLSNLNNDSETKNILVGKKTYNTLVSKYLKFKHHNTEKKELINHKENKNNKYNLNNIKSEKEEEENHNTKSSNLSTNKYDNTRNRQSYKRYKNYKLLNNINSINNFDIKNDNNDNESININGNGKGCYEIKIREKKNSKNKKKHKGENKLKYNNLIKQKLFICESINKRKNLWKNNQDN